MVSKEFLLGGMVSKEFLLVVEFTMEFVPGSVVKRDRPRDVVSKKLLPERRGQE